jgi:outer membrane protein assembly factor BamB
MNDRIYLGISKYVVCIDRRNGGEYWRTEIKRGDPVTLVVSGDLIIACAGGRLTGLTKIDGTVVWENDLPGLGYGRCIIATEPGNESQQAQVVAASAAAAAAQSASASSSAAGA